MKKLILIALAITCSGCYDSYYNQHSQGSMWGQQTNKPVSVLVEPTMKATTEEYYWSKSNYSLGMVKAVLLGQCRYMLKTRFWKDRSDSDQCMLDKGFIYTDIDRGPEGFLSPMHPCRSISKLNDQYISKLPSCRSLTQPVPRNPKDLDCFESGEAQSKGTCGTVTVKNP